MGRTSSAARKSDPVNIALFDASTLVGKGVKSHLLKRRFPVGRVRAFDTGAVEEGGNITEFHGEALLAIRPDLDEMSQVDLAFYCGPSGAGEAFLDWPERGGFVAIDLTQAANRKEGVPVVNAWVNPNAVGLHRGVVASPHPVSQFLSTVLSPLVRSFPLREVVSLVLQPASEAGEDGIEELYRQTVGVLNFADVPKARFRRVLAFNLLPAFLDRSGDDAGASIAREVEAILEGASFDHSVRVLLAPVFHCHSFCCRVRFEREVGLKEIGAALSESPGLRLLQSLGPATPAELAGEEGIFVYPQADPSVPRGFWIWGVTDNLATGTALNAVRVAENLLRTGGLKGRLNP
jgi:aspartate-semialdehyde dehydrogenase